MKFDLQGKTALITGGGSGIGKAISIAPGTNEAFVHVLELSDFHPLKRLPQHPAIVQPKVVGFKELLLLPSI